MITLRTVFVCLIILLTAGLSMADWQSLGGPEGGSAYKYVRSSDGTVYVTANAAGIFKSMDNGQSWEVTGDGQDATIHKLFASASTSRMYLTTMFGNFYSDDGFATLSPFTVPSPNYGIDLIYALDDDNIVLVGRNPNITMYLTTDGGANWTETGSMGFTSPINCQKAPDGTLYIAVSLSGPVYRSTDSGSSWELISCADPTGFNDFIVTDSGALIGASLTNVYRSDDQGATWTEVITLAIGSGISSLTLDENGDIYGINLAPTIYHSSDDGLNFSEVDTDLPAYFYTTDLLAAGTDLLIGTEKMGVMLSSDGGATWLSSNTGFMAQSIDGIAASGGGDVYISAGTTGIYRRTAGFFEWELIEDITYNGSDVDVTIGNDGTIFAGSPNNLWRSTDDGTTWTALTTNTWPTNDGRIEIAPNGDVYITNVQWGVWRSTDNGDTWGEITGVTTVVDMDFDSNSNPNVCTSLGFNRSEDFGATWNTLVTGTHTVAEIDQNDNSIYLDNSGGASSLSRSDDNGSTWTDISQNIGPTSSYQTYAIGIDADGNIVADVLRNQYLAGIMTRSVYRSEDQGDTWVEDVYGLDHLNPLSFTAGLDMEFYMGTAGEVYIWGADISVDENESALIEDFKLVNIYPNPFNSSTRIVFETNSTTTANVAVYDILGHEVAVLFSGVAEKGIKTLNFQANDLASGLYFIKLDNGNSSITKKIILIK